MRVLESLEVWLALEGNWGAVFLQASNLVFHSVNN